MTITIYESRREALTKDLTSIEKKAKKYGCPFSFAFGEPYPKDVDVYETGYDESVHATVSRKISTITVEAVDLTINGDQLIRQNGWTAIAQLEHLENGNMVNRFDRDDKSPIPEDWRSRKPFCEHCGTRRDRKVTYMVQDTVGNLRQVGSSCLHDYTGINPVLASSWAILWDAIESNECNYNNYDPDREYSSGCRLYNVGNVIAHAVDAIRENKGYVKADSYIGTPTALVVGNKVKRDLPPSEEAVKKAQEIVAWLKSDECEHRWDLITDCAILARNEWCKGNHFGRLAYMPIAYDKEIAKIAEERRRAEQNNLAAKTSHHVGEIGKRVSFDIDSFEYITSWETVYGTTHLYKFTTNDGNVLVWFASKPFTHEITGRNGHISYEEYKPDEVHHITATVKDHTERDGIKQTVITRCKVS